MFSIAIVIFYAIGQPFKRIYKEGIIEDSFVRELCIILNLNYLQNYHSNKTFSKAKPYTYGKHVTAKNTPILDVIKLITNSS